LMQTWDGRQRRAATAAVPVPAPPWRTSDIKWATEEAANVAESLCRVSTSQGLLVVVLLTRTQLKPDAVRAAEIGRGGT
jgi:hypothetical protein